MAGTELARAYITLLPDMTGAGKSISAQLSGADVMRASDNAGRSIGSRLMGNVSSAIKTTTAVVGALGTAVAAIGIKGGIDRQLNIENAQAKLKGLGNSTETVTAIMQDALGAVKGTAFGLDQAATTAASAVAAGIKPGKELEKYLKLTADAATIAGTSMGDMGSIINKVTTSGKAQMDNLNQLSDRGIPIMQWLAEEYGVSSEALSKMVSEGKVDAETFRKVIEENIGGAALESGNTTTGAFANMRAALSRVGVTMTEWFFPLVKDVFNGVTTILDGLNDRMGPWADKFASWFQEKAGPVVDGFAGNVLAQVDRIAAAFKVFTTGDFNEEIRLALGADEDSKLVDYLFRARDIALEVKGGFVAMFAAFQAGGSDVTSSGFAGVMERIGLAARWMRDTVVQGVDSITTAFRAGAADAESTGFDGFMQRIGVGARRIQDAFKTLDFSSWDNFKKSLGPTGQQFGSAFESIGDSLVALKPAFKEFMAQLPKIGGSVGVLALAAVNGLAGGLAFLADHVDVIIKLMPLIVAGYVAWRVASLALTAQSNRLQMAQLAMAPVLLANNTLRLTSIILENRQTAARLRQTAATAAETGTTAANNTVQQTGIIARTRAAAATVAQRVATVASTVATKAAAAGQWLLNTAMRANPIGLIITGITALVGGLVLFFTKTETGKKIVAAAWDGIKSAVGFVVDWFQTSVMPALSAAWDAIGAGASWLYDNVIKPVWSGIQAAISISWGIIKPIFDAFVGVMTFLGKVFWNVAGLVIGAAWIALQIAFQAGWTIIQTLVFAPLKAAWEAIGAAFAWVWDNVIWPVWSGLQTALSAGWNWIRDNVFSLFKVGVGELGGAFTAAKDTAGRAWDNIKSAASTAWNWVKENVFAPFTTGIGAIGEAFNAASDIVGAAWDAIQGAAVKPVNFVIETVYNNGIKKLFDTVAEKLGLSQRLPGITPIGEPKKQAASARPINRGMYADGGVLPGYTPGRDVHDFYSPTAGWLHLSGGEGILRPEAVRDLGGAAGIAAINSKYTGRGAGGGSSFFLGGIWDAVKNGAGAAWDFTTDAASAIGNFMKDPVAGAVKVFSKPIEEVLKQIGGGDVGQIIAGAPRALIKGIIDGATRIFGPARDDGTDPATGGKPGPGGAAMGWQAMTSALRAIAPGVQITSGFRPGAKVAGTSIPSMHGLGRAIDLAPSMATFNKLLAAYPNATELLYSPAGARQRQRGAGGSFAGDTSGVTKQMHYNHIHWGMKDGGVWPGAPVQAGVFDNGGMLQPGGVAVNLSNRPEPVFSGQQWDDLRSRGSGPLIGEIKVAASDPEAAARAVVRRFEDAVSLKDLDMIAKGF